MKVTGYHLTKDIAISSDGDTCTEKPWLDFLLKDKGSSAIKVFYNLEYSVANLIKLINLTEEEAKILHEYGKLEIYPYTLKYYSNRGSSFFSIKDRTRHLFANFSNMRHYKLPEYKENETQEACLQFAKDAQLTGEKILEVLKSMCLHPKSLISPINIWEKEMWDKYNIPNLDDMPDDVHEYAFKTCTGNWNEAFAMGHFSDVYSYDINSAYPSELANLLDIRNGNFWKSTIYEPNADYGYVKGILTIDKPDIHPVFFNSFEEENIDGNSTAIGIHRGIYHSDKINYIVENRLGSFKIEDGCWFKATEQKYILRPLIEYFQTERLKWADPLQVNVVKRIPNGIWGKFLQINKKDGFPRTFNSIYGAETENNIHLSVANFARLNNLNILNITGDGILSNTYADVEHNGMGSWRRHEPKNCLIFGTGQVALDGKATESDFSLDYNKLKQMIEDDPNAESYTLYKKGCVSLGVALRDKKFDKIGDIITMSKTLTVGKDGKRCYKQRPKTGDELLKNKYYSIPWDISMIKVRSNFNVNSKHS